MGRSERTFNTSISMIHINNYYMYGHFKAKSSKVDKLKAQVLINDVMKSHASQESLKLKTQRLIKSLGFLKMESSSHIMCKSFAVIPLVACTRLEW